ncbi:unnamed protein product [Closterium sp. NIES-53]
MRLVKVLKSDRGGEFLGTDFTNFLKMNGIRHQLTCPGTLQKNDIAERANWTIGEAAKALLGAAGMPYKFWSDAVRHVITVKIRVLTHVGEKHWVPNQRWLGKKPAIDMLHMWGCMGLVMVPKDQRHKLEVAAVWAVHLGMAPDSKGWLMWDPKSKKTLVIRDVKFVEDVMYKNSQQQQQEVQIGLRLQENERSAVEEVQLHLDDLPGSELTSDHSGGGDQQVAEPGGVPAGGTRGLGDVGGGGAGSWGAGAGGTGTVAPTPRTVCFLTGEQQQQQQEQSQSQQQERVEEGSRLQQQSRGGVMAAPGEVRAGVPPAAAGAVTDTVGEIRGVTAAAGESSARVPVAAASAATAAAGEGRGGATGAEIGASTVAANARGGGAASLSSSQTTRRSPLSRAVSPEPRRSRYRADGPFHLVLRSRVLPLPVLPQPPESSLTVLHDPLSDYLRGSRCVVSRVLSALVTHPTAPLSSFSALVTTVVGFASSYCLDYAAHLVSGPARSPSSRGALVFPLEVLEDRLFELGFLAAAVPHLCAILLALEGDSDALGIPIPHTHAEAVSGPWALYWIAAKEEEMASYRSTVTYVDAVPPPGANVVSGMWLFKVKRPPGAPPVFKAHYVARGFSQREGVDFFQTFAPTPKMTILRVLLHIAAQRDNELHSLDCSIAFLQGSLHDQIWLRRPPGFTGTFPLGNL